MLNLVSAASIPSPFPSLPHHYFYSIPNMLGIFSFPFTAISEWLAKQHPVNFKIWHHCGALYCNSPGGLQFFWNEGGGPLVHVKKRVAKEQFCKPWVRCVQLLQTTNSAPVTSDMTATSTFVIWTSIANASFIAGTPKVIAIPNRCLATAKRPLKSNLMAQQRPRCACESGLATTGGSSKVNSKALHQKVRHIGSTSR